MTGTKYAAVHIDEQFCTVEASAWGIGLQMYASKRSAGYAMRLRSLDKATCNGRDGIARIVKPVHSDEWEKKRTAFRLSSGKFLAVAFLQYLKSVQRLTHK